MLPLPTDFGPKGVFLRIALRNLSCQTWPRFLEQKHTASGGGELFSLKRSNKKRLRYKVGYPSQSPPAEWKPRVRQMRIEGFKECMFVCCRLCFYVEVHVCSLLLMFSVWGFGRIKQFHLMLGGYPSQRQGADKVKLHLQRHL